MKPTGTIHIYRARILEASTILDSVTVILGTVGNIEILLPLLKYPCQYKFRKGRIKILTSMAIHFELEELETMPFAIVRVFASSSNSIA